MVLELTDVKLTVRTPDRKKREILKKINFSIPESSLVGFVGVNGAGKTTSIKSILGFLNISAGTIKYFDNQALTEGVRSKIGFLPERPYFYEFLTGAEFLKLYWDLRSLGSKSDFQVRCDEVLKLVDLERGRALRLRSFSKGMLQRIGLAQAILHRPQFLVLDEPMSGLDPDGRLLVKEIMKRLHADGVTIFFSSHLLQDMQELCDRLVIIDQGHTIFTGTLNDFTTNVKDEYQISWLDPSKQGVLAEVIARSDVQNKIDYLRGKHLDVLSVQKPVIQLEVAFHQLLSRTRGANIASPASWDPKAKHEVR